jgi:transposase
MYMVEIYGRVRRAVLVEGQSRRSVAREFGVSRKTIQKMLTYSVPTDYQRQLPIRRPKLGPWLGVIDAILKEDKTRPVNLSLWKREAAARLVRDDRSHIARLGGCQPDSMTRNLPASAANLSGLCPDFLSAAMFCPPI